MIIEGSMIEVIKGDTRSLDYSSGDPFGDCCWCAAWPATLNPEPSTLNPEPQTLNPMSDSIVGGLKEISCGSPLHGHRSTFLSKAQ